MVSPSKVKSPRSSAPAGSYSRPSSLPLVLVLLVLAGFWAWSQQRDLIHHYMEGGAAAAAAQAAQAAAAAEEQQQQDPGAPGTPPGHTQQPGTAASASSSSSTPGGARSRHLVAPGDHPHPHHPLHQQQHDSSLHSSAAHRHQDLPLPGCEAEQRPRVALLVVVVGYEGAARHDAYWVAVANRRAYVLQHGYPLYLVPQELGSGQHAAWEKFVALQAVFQHSCAQWVWMSDADAYVMNLASDIHAVAADPHGRRNPKQECGAPSPDVILAGACLAKVNTGSVLWRNTGWTHQYVADAWHSKHIARPANWWDQAAVLHLMKQPDIRRRHCLVYQRAINAYPNMTRCHDGGGVFKEGDLLVHFPGGMKIAIANITSSRWLRSVPLLPSDPALAHARASVWTISAYPQQPASGGGSGGAAGPAGGWGEGRRLHVSMPNTMYAANASAMPTEFSLLVAPQQQGYDNWGWPVEPPKHPHPAAAAAAAAAGAKAGHRAARRPWQQHHHHHRAAAAAAAAGSATTAAPAGGGSRAPAS